MDMSWAPVFRRVARKTAKAWDRFWDHHPLLARGRRRGCQQLTRRRRFAWIRIFLQACTAKRRGTRRRRPPPRGRPDPVRLGRRRTRGRHAHLPACCAGGAAASPNFYAARRRGPGQRRARRLGRSAAGPGGGGRPRGRAEPLRGRRSRRSCENAHDSFLSTAVAPLGGRPPRRARPPRRPKLRGRSVESAANKSGAREFRTRDKVKR